MEAKRAAFRACTLASMSRMVSTCWKTRTARTLHFSIGSDSPRKLRRRCMTMMKFASGASYCALKHRNEEVISSAMTIDSTRDTRYNLRDILVEEKVSFHETYLAT